MLILGIESSCDETAAALVEDGIREISSTVASSKDLHEITGGVVPEVAARKQLESILPVIDQTLSKAGLTFATAKSSVDAIGVTTGPGLAGSLTVGVEAAKTLAVLWDKPLIPVNHLVGHIYGNFVNNSEFLAKFEFPAVVLVVSGGHTDLILMRGHGDFEYLGGTIDDAAGEAFDKTARLLGISKYLGGALLSKKGAEVSDNTIKKTLPRPLINDSTYDFSFSGLKTAVKRMIEKSEHPQSLVAREFEDAIVDVLVQKTKKAFTAYNAKSVLLAGGVSANQTLRNRMIQELAPTNVFVPTYSLCTDNAVYIASAAYFNQIYPNLSQIDVLPSLSIMDKPYEV